MGLGTLLAIIIVSLLYLLWSYKSIILLKEKGGYYRISFAEEMIIDAWITTTVVLVTILLIWFFIYLNKYQVF